MIFVRHETIQIPQDRIRQAFDERKLTELRESIARVGLIQPLAAERNGDTWVLRAGERRLRAIRSLIEQGVRYRHGDEVCSDGLVPVVEWSELSPLQRLEIEVEENIIRTDFDWKERSRAIESLHKLRSEQNPKQTVRDTATEVAEREGKATDGEKVAGRYHSDVADHLVIAKHLDNPEVAKAKDAKEALKIIRRNAEAVHQAKLAKQFDLTKTSHRLILGDTRVLLPSLPAASFDVILTDPPYGVGADTFGSQSSTGHDYEDSPKYLEELLQVLPDELYRVAKERAHCYLFCSRKWFERIETLMVLANWTVFPEPLIWDKCGTGMVPYPKHGPRRTYECILYAWKGDRETLVLKNDIIRVPAVRNLKHAAQKPVALYAELLSRSARPGDAVLDCFGGTGPVLVAANIRRATATYIENKEANFNIATSRVHTKEIDDGSEENDGLEIKFE